MNMSKEQVKTCLGCPNHYFSDQGYCGSPFEGRPANPKTCPKATVFDPKKFLANIFSPTIPRERDEMGRTTDCWYAERGMGHPCQYCGYYCALRHIYEHRTPKRV